MPSLCMEWRAAGKSKTAGFRRCHRGLAPAQASKQFPEFVAKIASLNGYEVLEKTGMEATLGLTVCGKPVVHVYVYIEPHTPPTAAEPGQPWRARA